VFFHFYHGPPVRQKAEPQGRQEAGLLVWQKTGRQESELQAAGGRWPVRQKTLAVRAALSPTLLHVTPLVRRAIFNSISLIFFILIVTCLSLQLRAIQSIVIS
jgi:hypothetical protein